MNASVHYMNWLIQTSFLPPYVTLPLRAVKNMFRSRRREETMFAQRAGEKEEESFRSEKLKRVGSNLRMAKGREREREVAKRDS